jgi:hypothetical protein
MGAAVPAKLGAAAKTIPAITAHKSSFFKSEILVWLSV